MPIFGNLTKANSKQDGYISSSDYVKFNTNIQVYYNYPITGLVVENDIVMNIVNEGNGQAPLSFKLAVNNGSSYYPAIYGVAKNVNGSRADIYIGKNSIIPGFNFGAFIGVEYYLDPANPGKLTWTPPVVGSGVNPIKIGRALDSSNLILDPIGNFVQEKGGLYTSDGSYDEVLSVGTNGNVLVADSTQANGLKYAPAVVAGTGLTYTLATRSLVLSNLAGDVTGTPQTNTIAAATVTGKALTGFISGAGTVSATDTILTAFNKINGNIALKSPLASPAFTGDINSSTGNVLISTLGKGVQIKTGVNSKIGTVVLVAGTATVANTSVTANSRIFLTSQTDGGTPGSLRVSIKTIGTSFVITSSSALDTSTVAWMIVESIP